MCCSSTFVVLAVHTLVLKMYLKMAWHAIYWYVCVCLVPIYMSVLNQINSGHQETQFAFKSIPLVHGLQSTLGLCCWKWFVPYAAVGLFLNYFHHVLSLTVNSFTIWVIFLEKWSSSLMQDWSEESS